MEPRRRNQRHLNLAPFLLGERRLHQLQLMQVALPANALLPADFAPRNDAVAGHDLALLLNQRDDVRVVEAEHRGVGFLQGDRARELVPHVAPEARAVVLARAYGVKAGIELERDDVLDGRGLEGVEVGRRLAGADGLTGIEEGLGAEEGTHVLGAEGGCHVG